MQLQFGFGTGQGSCTAQGVLWFGDHAHTSTATGHRHPSASPESLLRDIPTRKFPQKTMQTRKDPKSSV